jgi:subtilisin family serine protease
VKDNFPKVLEFESNQLVVDLPYADLVIVSLQHDVRVPKVIKREDNETLGLALLELDGLTETADRIGLERPDIAAKVRERTGRGIPDDIDVVVADLRDRLARRFSGFVPDMGKNRQSGVVSSTPGTQGIPPASLDNPAVPAGEMSREQYLQAVRNGAMVRDNAGDGISVAIVDTPLPNGAPATGPLQPVSGHGEFVRGVVEAMAPGATITVTGALNGDTARATAWDAALGIARAATTENQYGRRPDVINMSFACRTTDGEPPFVLRRAIEILGNDVLAVAAAGNHGADWEDPLAPMWPAALPGVIAVGALTESDAVARFSPLTAWVNCLARGADVLSTYLSGMVALTDQENPTEFKGYARWSGTSFAAAYVSGSVAGALDPTKRDVRAALQDLLNDPASRILPFDWERGRPW